MLDALVVLGCKVGPALALSPAAKRRAERAARAYRAYLPEAVICSGGRNWDGSVEAIALAAYLVKAGIPQQRIVCECRSLSTCENATYVSEIAAKLGLSRLGLVTCEWHLSRAMKAFSAAGSRVVGMGAPAPLSSRQRWWSSWRERLSWPVDSGSTFGCSSTTRSKLE